MASNSRARGRLGGLAATALVVSGLVAATPATASDSPSSDALAWGFKESFRRYVAGPMNSEPVGSRIVPQAPASFDGEGDETRPYLFPVASAAFTDVDNVAIGTAGGVTYNFPSHFFTITVSDVEVEVVAGEARVVADIDSVVTQSSNGFEAGEYHEQDVHLADVGAVSVSHTDGVVHVSGTEVTLASEGAAYLPYSEGDALDDFSLEALSAPVVEISRSVFSSEGAASVTVTGRGFYHRDAIGTRPPLAGKGSGAYVAVGYFPDTWRPSVDARAARPAVSAADGGQRWAVPAESIPVPIAPQAGGIELAPDGSFSTELTIDQAVIDAAARAKGVTDGNYGIYTYAGSGAVVPKFETSTPIAFQSAPLVAAAPQDAEISAGGSASFSVDVTGAESLQWQSRAGSGSWADVVGATGATLEVTALTVAQSGSQYRVLATNAAGTVESSPATLTVTQATASVSVRVKKKVRFAAKPSATVTVAAPEGVASSGAVTLRAGTVVVGKGMVRDGQATVTLTKRLAPGARKLVAEFAGNADLRPATSSAVKVKVLKAAAKVKAKLAKKSVKAGKRAVVRVKVTATGVKPRGKVKVTISRGGTTVRTLTVKVKGGKVAKVRVPRLSAGKFTVKARFTGSAKVAPAAKKLTLRVR